MFGIKHGQVALCKICCNNMKSRKSCKCPLGKTRFPGFSNTSKHCYQLISRHYAPCCCKCCEKLLVNIAHKSHIANSGRITNPSRGCANCATNCRKTAARTSIPLGRWLIWQTAVFQESGKCAHLCNCVNSA